MNNEKEENFIQYMDTRISATQEYISHLTADHRKDESDFEKIRANIYQILKTIFQASQKMALEEDEQTRFLHSRLVVIENNWRASLKKAEEYHDERKILQEQIKLEVMDEVHAAFPKLWEVII